MKKTVVVTALGALTVMIWAYYLGFTPEVTDSEEFAPSGIPKTGERSRIVDELVSVPRPESAGDDRGRIMGELGI